MISAYINPLHTVLIVVGSSFTFFHYYGYFETAPIESERE
jgi:hypothetical protein